MSGDPRSVPPRSMPFPPGTVLAGKYRVERLLGEGGMGWVVVATHLQLEQRVALKFMRPSHARDTSDAVPRFLREARAAARIQSEHVARVMDVGTLENGAPYLVMEYLEGQDLESLLSQHGALPPEVVVEYVMQACEGLGEAHAAGIVHRDLKPANLFLARRSDGSVRVKLLDFGISKLAAAGGGPEVAMTNTQALMGSPLYMAPEQMRSSKNVDGRADIWSMGVILYEMLGGRAPFDGETLPVVCARIMTEPPPPLRSVKPDVPPELEAVVVRCLDKEPQQRFQDVASLARALAPFATPEARVAAERIARMARASALSAPEIVRDGGPAPVPSRRTEGRGGELPENAAPAASAVAQTRATFTQTGSAQPRRKGLRALPLAIGAAVLFLGAAVVFGVVATRGRTKAESVATATATSTATPTPTPTPTATATATATSTPTPTPTPTPTSTSTPEAPATAASAGRPSPPIPAVPSRPQPRPKPGTTTQKPVGTAGFGGRD